MSKDLQNGLLVAGVAVLAFLLYRQTITEKKELVGKPLEKVLI